MLPESDEIADPQTCPQTDMRKQARMHADRETRAYRNVHCGCALPLKVATGISVYVLATCVLVAEPRAKMIVPSYSVF